MGALKRRELLAGAGLVVLGSGVGCATAASAKHDHPVIASPSALAEAARACVAEGEACLAHCLQAFAAGDASLAGCARTVEEMLTICQAVSRLATTGSKHLGSVAAACRAICADCETECRKHESHHEVCKRCAAACARVVRVIDGRTA